MFLMMSILSLPSYLFYFSGNKAYDISFKDFVLKLSLGNVGMS